MASQVMRFILTVSIASGSLLLGMHYCSSQIPGGSSVVTANSVGQFIAAGYPKFDSRASVEKAKSGKTYYVRPGVDGDVTLIVYEVTTSQDMALIEDLARKALVEVPGAHRICLQFYEAQNMPSGVRGPEKMLKTVWVNR